MAAAIIDKAKAALGKDSNTLKMVDCPIGSTGFGLMGLTWRANPPPQEQAFSAMKAALDNGANLWNGGEIYGNSQRNSLHLLAEYFEKNPGDASKVVISIKGGCNVDALDSNGSPENTKRSIEECLRVLGGKKKLDIWEAARVDTNVPIEVTMREADKFVKSGQLGAVGLSEASAATIRRAAKITKIAAVEVEFSLWETTILSNGIAKTCAELDIPIVAYSPLGRGFLTGQYQKPEDIPVDNPLRAFPRFQGENFYKNLDLVNEVKRLADRKGCTPGQVAIAWVKAQGRKPGMPTFIPIPGATTVERVNENMKDIELSDSDVKEIDSLVESIEVKGDRYPTMVMHQLFGDTPEE